MRHASSILSRASAGVLMWTVALTCLLALTTADEESVKMSNVVDGDVQMDEMMSKRDWQTKRWELLHGVWGRKRRNVGAMENELSNLPQVAEKRAWQSLQGGWGKRLSPTDEEMALELAAMLEERNNQYGDVPYDFGNDYDLHEAYPKRNWNKFSDGWGKRTKWEKFRGSWGKREPAWSNLKGIWGKRSVPN